MKSCLPLMCLDGTPQSVRIAALHGRRFRAAVIGPGGGPEMDLRTDPDVVHRLDELETSQAKKLAYVECTLAPRSIRFSDGIDLGLGISNYARFRAAAELLQETPESERIDAMRRTSLGTLPGFSHSLGVNCTLETADAKLVWSRRSAKAAVGGGLLSVAMSEGATVPDLIGGSWNPVTTAQRGFVEEFGLPATDTDGTPLMEFAFHSLIAQVEDGGISVLGHARTILTADEVLSAQVKAPDAHELERIIVIDASIDAVSNLLTSHAIRAWTSWASASIFGLSLLRFAGAPVDRVSIVQDDAAFAGAA